MTNGTRQITRGEVFASVLATSWTYEKLLPSEQAFDAAVRLLGDACSALSPLDVARPDWRTTTWNCRSDRGVDLEFVAAAVGAATLLQDVNAIVNGSMDEAGRRIHRALFGRVWDDAGEWRQGNLNVGVSSSFVASAMRDLDADWRAWRSTEPFAEAVARLHARFEQIHPFPDGNGRTGRLLCDLVLLDAGHPPATWGAELANGRATYLEALEAALFTNVRQLAALVARSGA